MSSQSPHVTGKSARHSGFTIIELLISIGLIFLLIAILLPVLALARRNSKLTVCQSNLRQWSNAVTAYAVRNDGYLPRRGQGQQQTTLITRPEDWFNALPVVLGTPTFYQLAATNRLPRVDDRSIWVCPETIDLVNGYLFTYGMNMWLSTWMTAKPDRFNNVGDATTMVFMADASGGFCSIVPAAAPYSPVARHSGRVNIAFLDGHVTSFTGASVGCGVGDPLRPDVRWVVPGSTWGGPK